MYLAHQKETPITHNSLIAASIMQSQTQELPIKNVKTICDTVYQKMRENGAKTYISVSP